MTRHPAARRLHQQKTSDDAVTERLLQFFVWAKKNTRIIGGALAVIVVAVLATTYSVKMREARHAESMRRLNEVRQTAYSGNYALALRDLETFISQFSGTSAADEARILMAQVSLEEGQPEQALEAVAPLARKLNAPLGASAAMLMATAHEVNGNGAEAIATYLRIADGAPLSYQRREAIELAARLSEEIGDHTQAIELYQRLVEQTEENSPERGLAEMRLAEARARASGS